MEDVTNRWNQLPESGMTLDKDEGGLIWLGHDRSEVLSLITGQVRGKWQINAIAYRMDTFDHSGVDMSQSIYEIARVVADSPRLPTITTFVFCDEGAAGPAFHDYWLREMHMHLWDTVETNLEMYLDRPL